MTQSTVRARVVIPQGSTVLGQWTMDAGRGTVDEERWILDVDKDKEHFFIFEFDIQRLREEERKESIGRGGEASPI